ncbi:MAG: hypothetical protein KJO40_14790 [Deltaproteobacteria bacterium]|nr:hypothetical protein [Deltaproteobacteria bacterium]NNK08139.1 hypothetical protein [Myxococcales bacterium]MBT8466388.1 hypothetical protein [Deltaproteobacteria bacterium]MBT8480840.1 hypothetical protein [Deltaproteobacteria bacterium]NNK42978.1 hypothetical protein [Myxococcales bacterium]
MARLAGPFAFVARFDVALRGALLARFLVAFFVAAFFVVAFFVAAFFVAAFFVDFFFGVRLVAMAPPRSGTISETVRTASSSSTPAV